MDIDELTDAFIQAFDAWCETCGMGGPTFDAMLDARDRLEQEREKIKRERE